MNQQHPTVEQFLGTPYSPEEDHDEDNLALAVEQWKADPGVMWQIPPDPMESIARDVHAILVQLTASNQSAERTNLANGLRTTPTFGEMDVQSSGVWEAEVSQSIESGLEAILQGVREELADLEAKAEVMAQVIADVDAALGKSKAAPALAAKAVIEAWRNPLVPVEEILEESPDQEAATLQVHEQTASHIVTVPAIVTATVPEHAAPVEEWRAYARALGYAGPEIDKANRSQIRTALGISQVSES